LDSIGVHSNARLLYTSLSCCSCRLYLRGQTGQLIKNQKGRWNLRTGVGTAEATGALAPAMLKPRGRKYLSPHGPTIICQVYQLVSRQTSKSIYSFKIIVRSSFVHCNIFYQMSDFKAKTHQIRFPLPLQPPWGAYNVPRLYSCIRGHS